MKLFILIFFTLVQTTVSAQQNYQFKLYATNNAGKTDSVIIGIDDNATDGLDVAFGETLLNKTNMDSTFALFVLGKNVPQSEWYKFIKPDSVTKKQVVSKNTKRAYIYLLCKDTAVTFKWNFDASKTKYKYTMFKVDNSTWGPVGFDLNEAPVFIKNQPSQIVDLRENVISFVPYIKKQDSTLFNVNYKTHIVFIQFADSTINNVGLNNKELSNINIYPNPTQYSLNVVGNDNFEYTVVSTTGTELFNGKLTNDNSTILLNNIAKGVYYIHFKNEQATITKKIIIE
ncbi:MAG: T9SS type A sorting domain-containing protein [Bacteroidia bacterium]|nr:T9SS type A sorting domain-containing protein [Bacteroidia bacterium]